MQEFLSKLFHPRADEKGKMAVWFEPNCPLERAVAMILTELSGIQVLDEQGKMILNLGDPDPKILPVKS